MEAMVTDVDVSSAVAGLRGLGRRGIPSVAVGPRRCAAGSWSRYARSRAVAPDVVRDPMSFAHEIGHLAERHGDPIVYPGREEAIDALLDGARAGVPVTLAYPDPAAVQAVRDKRRLGDLARRAGFDVPPALAEVKAAQLPGVRAPFPFVVKPARPGGSLRTAKLVRSEEEVRALAQSHHAELELLVQEYAPGPQVGVALVVGPEGEIVERFQHTVRRTWPPHGGATSLAVSVACDVELVHRCAAMLALAGYSGLAQFDLVRAGHGYQVLDVNPRYYVSLPLATRCGVNLPAAWHDMLRGRSQGEPSPYVVGVRYRWLEADLTVLRHRWRPMLGPRAGALWDPRDPLPALIMGSRAARQRAGAFVAAKGGRVWSGATARGRRAKASL